MFGWRRSRVLSDESGGRLLLLNLLSAGQDVWKQEFIPFNQSFQTAAAPIYSLCCPPRSSFVEPEPCVIDTCASFISFEPALREICGGTNFNKTWRNQVSLSEDLTVRNAGNCCSLRKKINSASLLSGLFELDNMFTFFSSPQNSDTSQAKGASPCEQPAGSAGCEGISLACSACD